MKEKLIRVDMMQEFVESGVEIFGLAWFTDSQVQDFYTFWKSKGKPQNIEIAWDTHINIRRLEVL